jgi:hypothetical protein
MALQARTAADDGDETAQLRLFSVELTANFYARLSAHPDLADNGRNVPGKDLSGSSEPGPEWIGRESVSVVEQPGVRTKPPFGP